ncbi:MAG TPA: PilZ domain-containing protein [Candidatus Sulfotelmatobacter sp.]|nr:PilZ domain-containing protein [Candidatus Sulfotelmatobacter sp.]
METHSQFGTSPVRKFVEQRCAPRYLVDVGIRVYPRNSAVVRGETVDLSESGISAMLRTEVPLGEVVRLEFTLPAGEIEVLATVRQKTAFRYGFQFLDCGTVKDVIRRACRELAMAQAALAQKNP